MSFKHLQAAAVREAAMQDAYVAAFEADLAALIKRLMRRLRTELVDWDVDDDDRLVSELGNLARALNFRKQLGQWLEEEGFSRLAARVLDEPLDRLAESVFRTNALAGKAARLGPAGVDVLAAFKELRLADLLELGPALARKLAAVALEGLIGLRPVDALVQDFADVAGLTERQARTVYDTAVSTYTRQVEQLHASGEDDELFVYVGPADSRMREFCRQRVGKVFDRKAIDEMDNGQLPNVFLSGGGYNCRHTWKRVSLLDDELIALHDSGKRVPEIQAQLERIAA